MTFLVDLIKEVGFEPTMKSSNGFKNENKKT